MKRMKVEIVAISPDMAASMLERNTMNRPLDSSRVSKYALIMKSGQWRINGENIILAKDGTILDGQHRLWAILEAGITVEIGITYNIPLEYFSSINHGKTRSDSDVVYIAGFKNAKIVAPVVRLAYLYDVIDLTMPIGRSRQISSDLILNYAKSLQEDGIDESVELATTGKHHFKPTVMAFCHLIFSRKNAEKAKIFFLGVKSGENLSIGSPILALRGKLIDNASAKHKLSIREEIALYIKAWNAFVKGKSLVRLSWNSEIEEFPGVK